MISRFLIIIGSAFLLLNACKNNTTSSTSNTSVDPNLPTINNPATDADTPPPNADQLPIMTFENDTHHFGKIKEGEVVHYDFKFTNTGKTDLVISSARGSCGCTVPEYPKEPIAAGKSSVIKVEFDSKGKSGAQKKAVTLTYNGYPNKKVIYIESEVLGGKPTNEGAVTH